MQASRSKWVTPDSLEGLRGKWYSGPPGNSPGFEITPETEYWGNWKSGKPHGLGVWRSMAGAEFSGEWAAGTKVLGHLEDSIAGYSHSGEFGVGQSIKWITYLKTCMETENVLLKDIIPRFGILHSLEGSLGIPGNLVDAANGGPSKQEGVSILASKLTVGTSRLQEPQVLEGFGQCTWSFSNGTQSVASGVFKQGRLHGVGAWEHHDCEHTGEWRDGLRDGFGVESCVGQSFSFRGHYRGDKRQGYGECRGLGRFGYKGQFADGRFEGIGQLEDSEAGWLFVGQLSNNLFQGSGQFETQQYLYLGDWNKGLKEGIGFERIEKENGISESYFGYFQAGKRDGLGRILPTKSNPGCVGLFQNGTFGCEVKKSDPSYHKVSKSNLESHMQQNRKVTDQAKEFISSQAKSLMALETKIVTYFKQQKDLFILKDKKASLNTIRSQEAAFKLQVEILDLFENSKEKMIKGLVPFTEEDLKARTEQLNSANKSARTTMKEPQFDLGAYLDSGAVDDGSGKLVPEDHQRAEQENPSKLNPTRIECLDSDQAGLNLKADAEIQESSKQSVPIQEILTDPNTSDKKQDSERSKTETPEKIPTSNHHKLSIQLPQESAKASDDYDEESRVQSYDFKDDMVNLNDVGFHTKCWHQQSSA